MKLRLEVAKMDAVPFEIEKARGIFEVQLPSEKTVGERLVTAEAELQIAEADIVTDVLPFSNVDNAINGDFGWGGKLVFFNNNKRKVL